MVRWMRWHCPPDTGFETRALVIWGRARYRSGTEAPHNIESLRVNIFVSLKLEGESGVRTFDLWLPKQACSFNHCIRAVIILWPFQCRERLQTSEYYICRCQTSQVGLQKRRSLKGPTSSVAGSVQSGCSTWKQRGTPQLTSLAEDECKPCHLLYCHLLYSRLLDNIHLTHNTFRLLKRSSIWGNYDKFVTKVVAKMWTVVGFKF